MPDSIQHVRPSQRAGYWREAYPPRPPRWSLQRCGLQSEFFAGPDRRSTSEAPVAAPSAGTSNLISPTPLGVACESHGFLDYTTRFSRFDSD